MSFDFYTALEYLKIDSQKQGKKGETLTEKMNRSPDERHKQAIRAHENLTYVSKLVVVFLKQKRKMYVNTQ